MLFHKLMVETIKIWAISNIALLTFCSMINRNIVIIPDPPMGSAVRSRTGLPQLFSGYVQETNSFFELRSSQNCQPSESDDLPAKLQTSPKWGGQITISSISSRVQVKFRDGFW